MRRKIILLILCSIALCGGDLSAQLNKQYFYYVGRSFLIDNRYKEAIETLNVLLRVDSEAYEAFFLRGIAKYNLDDLLGAEQDFSKAIELNPVFTTAFQYRAITRSRLGNYDDALHDFQEAVDLRPDLPGPYYSRGVTYLLSQQFEKAIDDFNRFIRFDNKVPDAYINRGTSYLFLKDTLSASQNFDLAIQTNREYPEGYVRRGALRLSQNRLQEALDDFDAAIKCDSTYMVPYFNRALTYNRLDRPTQAIADFDRVVELDPKQSQAYFNRAIVRNQIGDNDRALEDYNRVALLSPENVLVYYNRAGLYYQLGRMEESVKDYSKAIELYPDFANAYLNRAAARYLLRDVKGAERDRTVAERKIANYRSHLKDSTSSVWADTSQKFNKLLAFDSKFSAASIDQLSEQNDNITLRPLYRFTMINPTQSTESLPDRYYSQRVEDFKARLDDPLFDITCQPSDITTDSLIAYDSRFALSDDWLSLFKRGITQSLIRQYTNAITTYTAAVALNPTNPFLYINRSTTQAEMIDFISSIDNSYQRITIESDPVARLRNNSSRVYNYDEAIADLNKAAKLMPDLAYIYYNRGGLLALSGKFPEAFDDYSKAIELNPSFAEAYFNRGLVQIYMKDTKKGCLDVSKAGELGIKEAYTVLKRYTSN